MEAVTPVQCHQAGDAYLSRQGSEVKANKINKTVDNCKFKYGIFVGPYKGKRCDFTDNFSLENDCTKHVKV